MPVCKNCGAPYTRKVKWCLRCYDDQGRLLNRNLTITNGKVIYTPRSALSILTGLIREAGYFENVRAKALGQPIGGKFPTTLATACYWYDYTGRDWHDPTIESLARQYLQDIFNFDYTAYAETVTAQHG